MCCRVETAPEHLWVGPSSDAAKDAASFEASFGPFYRVTQLILTTTSTSSSAHQCVGRIGVLTFGWDAHLPQRPGFLLRCVWSVSAIVMCVYASTKSTEVMLGSAKRGMGDSSVRCIGSRQCLQLALCPTPWPLQHSGFELLSPMLCAPAPTGAPLACPPSSPLTTWSSCLTCKRSLTASQVGF